MLFSWTTLVTQRQLRSVALCQKMLDGIARTFLESAEYHAELDPERYSTPAVETISARYREGLQHPSRAGREIMTLVADLSGEIVGFIDARLEQSPDAMHREMIYCHIAEIGYAAGTGIKASVDACFGRLRTGGAGWVRSSHHWNITLQTRERACSIRSVWAIA